MKLQSFSTIIICLFPVLLIAQATLEPGFEMLEQGKFDKAEAFFEAALETNPNQITARICYGRAVGLNGSPQKALDVFSILQREYPDNMEISLNKAEAFMWGQNYNDARLLFDQLLQRDSLNFSANLGAANARAASKDYVSALPLINRALDINPGNDNARISRKFILLGLASLKKRAWLYPAAHKYLDEVEAMYPGDKNARLLRSDIFLSQQKYRAAHDLFLQMIKDSMEVTRAYSGLSYTSLLLNKKKDALTFARKALETITKTSADSILRLNTAIQYVNALGFNRRFDEAIDYLLELEQQLGTSLTIQSARARMHVWNNNFKKGAAIYEALLTEHQQSFDLLMGMVETKRASQELDEAINYLNQARQISPDQPDAFRLWHQLMQADQPSIVLGGSQLTDDGGNVGQSLHARIDLGRMGRFRPFIEGNNWQAFNQESTEPAQQNTLITGTGIQLNSKIKINLKAGTTVFQSKDSTNQLAPMGGLNVNFLLGKYHNFDLGLSKALHHYTADLVRSGIVRNQVGLSYNFAAPTRFGLYTSYSKVFQSDGNTQQSIFASVYFKLLNAPVLKAGINYNSMGFDQQKPELYFSPRSSQAVEGFMQFSSDQSSGKKLVYHAFLSVGMQRVFLNTPQRTTRIDLSIGYRFKPNFEIMANFQAGNTVQSSLSGYAFKQIGVKMQYRLPVADKQLRLQHPKN
jgi:tetratricopeptide (TPR) repeat protein